MLSFVPSISEPVTDVVFGKKWDGKKGGVSKGRNNIKNFLLCMEIVWVSVIFFFLLKTPQLLKLMSVYALNTVLLGTMLSTSLIYTHHRNSSYCHPPFKHTHAHTLMHVHGARWLLFIVHSFMWRPSSLAWYCISFSPLSPSLPFPEGLADHKPTTLIV